MDRHNKNSGVDFGMRVSARAFVNENLVSLLSWTAIIVGNWIYIDGGQVAYGTSNIASNTSISGNIFNRGR